MDAEAGEQEIEECREDSRLRLLGMSLGVGWGNRCMFGK